MAPCLKPKHFHLEQALGIHNHLIYIFKRSLVVPVGMDCTFYLFWSRLICLSMGNAPFQSVAEHNPTRHKAKHFEYFVKQLEDYLSFSNIWLHRWATLINSQIFISILQNGVESAVLQEATWLLMLWHNVIKWGWVSLYMIIVYL